MLFSKYFKGDNREEVISLVKDLNKKKIDCSAAFLPTKNVKEKDVEKTVKEYYSLMEDISKGKVRCDVTIKLHQLGIHKDKETAKKSVEDIVSYGRKKKVFVWVDMVSENTRDDTIEIFKGVRKKYKNVGICLQAYRKRSGKDMKDLLRERVPMRLVKGFFRESDYDNWEQVTKNYSKLMKYLLLNSPNPAVATHDLELIEKAKKIIREEKIKNAEFQFFKGVRDDLAEELVKEGFNVRIYVPYGNFWRYLIDGFFTFDLYHQTQRILGFRKVV